LALQACKICVYLVPVQLSCRRFICQPKNEQKSNQQIDCHNSKQRIYPDMYGKIQINNWKLLKFLVVKSARICLI